MQNKSIAVLGATGSVGTQALDVAKMRGYRVDFMSAGSSYRALESYARLFRPRAVAMADEASAKELRLALADTDISVLCGEEGILEGIEKTDAEVVVNSILGEAGLAPSLAVIDSGRRLALANKESLVIAGELVMGRARERGVEIIPVDSEHSAIFQSLHAGRACEIKNIILTASGGPFFGKTAEQLSEVTLADTLNHPTWKMGKKITVDSATLMNKGFEVVEAAHLFGVPVEKIRVVVHRESILHSAVEYIDNSIIGEFSVPDMRMCVQYAVDYPNRCRSHTDPLDLTKVASLTFAEPDYDAFPLLSLASRAMKMGGAMCAVMNAADEVAVSAFLGERLRFRDIATVVTETVNSMGHAREAHTVSEIIEKDREARAVSADIIRRI